MTSQFRSIAKKIDALSEAIGLLCAWIVVLMVFLICYDVTMRYLFGGGSPALQELEWHLFAVIFLLGASYTLKHDEHVRVDLIYRSQRMSDKTRAWIDLCGTIIFLVPFCLLVIINSWPFVENSFLINETSPDPGGLPFRWFLKAMIPFGFILLLFQGLSSSLIKLLNMLEQQPSTNKRSQN